MCGFDAGNGCPFRTRAETDHIPTDHASNWLILKGTLGADKLRLLQELRAAIAAPEAAPLRPAWARGL